jgi:hypothetical protein
MIPQFKISELLSTAFEKNHSDDDDSLSLNDIMTLLHDRGFGILIMLFALPNFVPAFIPFVSTVFGVPQMILCLQMMLKYDAPKLPNKIGNKTIKRHSLQVGITKSIPLIKKMEKIIRPRMQSILTPSFEAVVAGFMLIFATLVSLPIPLGNFMPSVALFVIGMGILLRDGLAVIIGVIIGSIWTLLLIFCYGQLVRFVESLF